MTLGDDGLNISLLHMEFDLAFASFDAGLVAFSAATALLPFGAEKLCLNWHQCNTEFTQQQGLIRDLQFPAIQLYSLRRCNHNRKQGMRFGT